MTTIIEGLLAFIRAPEACNTPNRLFTRAKNVQKKVVEKIKTEVGLSLLIFDVNEQK